MNIIELVNEILREQGWDPQAVNLEQFLEATKELRNRTSLLCKWQHQPPKKTNTEKHAERKSQKQAENKAGDTVKEAAAKGKEMEENPAQHKWAWGQDKVDDELLMFQLGL